MTSDSNHAMCPRELQRLERLRQIQAGRLQFFCRQAVRIPIGLSVFCIYLVYMLWPYHDHTLLVTWGVITWGAMAVRAALSYWLAQRRLSYVEVERWTKSMILYCFLNGLLGGSAGLLFFSSSPLAEQALLTMLLSCWSAGAIAASGAIPMAYYAFLFPALAPIAWSWAVSTTPNMHGNVFTSVLLVLFAFYLVIFVRDNARMLTKSLLRRVKNTALIQVLNQKRNEAEIANRSKSRLLAAASHDLRQPLNALSINSYLLRKTIADEKTFELASEVEKSVQSLNKLFSGLLDISRLDAGMVTPNWQTCSIGAILEETARDHAPVARAKGLEFSVEFDDTPVRTDPILLGIVLRNLVSNAIRYTEKGLVRIRVDAKGDGLVVEVSDTGIGIPSDEIKHIYEEFYQASNRRPTSEQGCGLGLATVSRYIQLLQCSITVESDIKKGTTFGLQVPMAEPSVAQTSENQETATTFDRDLTGLTVLVIDDDKDVRMALHRLLTEWGCATMCGRSHREAIELIEKLEVGVEFIISDYRLRDAENGIDVLNRIQAQYGVIPSVLITADTARDRLMEAFASGFPVLHKPVTPDALKSKMCEILAVMEHS